MIRSVVFCPHPPLLVPAVATGAARETDQLREACLRAIRAACTGDVSPVLVGGGRRSRTFDSSASGSFERFGVPLRVRLDGRPAGADDGMARLPLSLSVGAWLLGRAMGPTDGVRAITIGPGFATDSASAALTGWAATGEVALVVLADGSARRGPSAPGYPDERATGFDATVAAALGAGDPALLADLDTALGEALMAGGVPVWHAVAALLAGRRFDARLSYDQAPYGVGYLVALWRTRGDGADG